MAQQGTGSGAHTEARVVGDRFFVTAKVDGVEPVGTFEDAPHQFGAYAPTLVSGQTSSHGMKAVSTPSLSMFTKPTTRSFPFSIATTDR